jgi:hypothetical protein
MGYVETMLFWGFLFIGLIFGLQLLVYWLIDKYTALNFPLIYRVGLAIIVIVGFIWIMNVRG